MVVVSILVNFVSHTEKTKGLLRPIIVGMYSQQWSYQ